MILDTNARPRPDPVGFVVTNGSNRWGNRSSGTPGPLSFTQNSSGSDTRVLAARKREAHARPKRGGELDFAVGGVLADRLGGVLHEIEKHLDELVAIGEHGRQRRIVFLDEFDVARDSPNASAA